MEWSHNFLFDFSGLRQNHDLFGQCNRKYNSWRSHHNIQRDAFAVYYQSQYETQYRHL